MTNDKALKSSVLHSLKWVALGRATTQILRWILTFWVISILTPEDYGIVAIADILSSLLVTMASTIAISPLVQARTLDKAAISSYFGITLCIYFLLFCFQYLLAEPIATLYKTPYVAEVLKVSAWCFLLMAFETIPSALLRRAMAFKKLALIDAMSNIIAAISTLLFAIYGYGFWALVYGGIVAAAVRVTLLLYHHPAPCLPSFNVKHSLPLIRFGGSISVFTLLWYIFIHLDITIGGLLLSTTEIGIFTVALNIAVMPQRKILPLVKEISFPAFSQLQDEPAKISYFIVKAQRLGLLFTLPIFWGLAAVSDYILPIILGQKWEAAILPTMLILVLMPLRFSDELFQPAAKALDKVSYLITNTLIMIAIIALALFITADLGATGLAMAWLLGFPLIYIIVLIRYSRLFNFQLGTFLYSISKIVLSAALMVISVIATKQLLGTPSILNLLLLISVGGVSYLLALFVVERKTLKELKQAISTR
ncbi:oligosaccharide flippase family protein [Rheinheimera baltica]|uniref:oligosaccharide flippase family protein n=1 Tax=Rheinheimera baltica TaxID=67576 RepID=UPI00273E2A98|nr:oligosaccharide flippase family protein [Rheinheimera baltica]MDP5148795.1 oligosaccharide flippase family protein [Rheinheimera baltica]